MNELEHDPEHQIGAHIEGSVLRWGYRVRAQRRSDGAVRFWYHGRWVDADSLTAATFKLPQ